MRHPAPTLAALLAAVALAACGDSPAPSADEPLGGDARLRVINGDVAPVAVVVDGKTVIASLAQGTISPALAVPAGARRVELRGATGVTSVDVTTTPTDTPTVAARVVAGRTEAAVIADTGRIVPPNASKLRVIHLAASAPPLDVWRTQPDWQTPVTIMFPFRYGDGSPYLQSAPGTWEVRVARGSGLPDGRPVAGGWDRALARLSLAVPAGQARTVVVLDGPGGTLRLETMDQP